MESAGARREAGSAWASWSWAEVPPSSSLVSVLHFGCLHQRSAMPLCSSGTAVHNRRGHFCPVAFAAALSPGRWAGGLAPELPVSKVQCCAAQGGECAVPRGVGKLCLRLLLCQQSPEDER